MILSNIKVPQSYAFRADIHGFGQYVRGAAGEETVHQDHKGHHQKDIAKRRPAGVGAGDGPGNLAFFGGGLQQFDLRLHAGQIPVGGENAVAEGDQGAGDEAVHGPDHGVVDLGLVEVVGVGAVAEEHRAAQDHQDDADAVPVLAAFPLGQNGGTQFFAAQGQVGLFLHPAQEHGGLPPRLCLAVRAGEGQLCREGQHRQPQAQVNGKGNGPEGRRHSLTGEGMVAGMVNAQARRHQAQTRDDDGYAEESPDQGPYTLGRFLGHVIASIIYLLYYNIKPWECKSGKSHILLKCSWRRDSLS